MAIAGNDNGTLIAAARALAPQIYAVREQIEQERRLPQPLVAALAEAGLFRMLAPKTVGGAEADLATYVQVVEELSRADGAAGWCVMICSNAAVASGYMTERAAQEVFGHDPRVIIGGSFIPRGRAIAVAGGYRISGRWTMASGSSHCTWFTAGCAILECGQPRLRAGGNAESLVAFLPRNDCEVIDTWSVGGLRGTASNDFSVAEVFVPADRTFSLRARAVQPGPLYAFPLISLLACSVASVTLGIARGAIDALVELAATKTPIGAQDVLRERGSAQAQVGRAEALVHGARAFLFEAIDSIWQDVGAGREVSLEQRALARLAAVNAAASAVQAVDLMYTAGGTSSIYTSNPLERAFRDVHTATQHYLVQERHFETAGRVLLGLEPVDGRQV